MITANNKFEIGQRVIYMDREKKAHQGEIESIGIYQYMNKQNICYSLKNKFSPFYENELFESKEELTNHIFQPDLIDFV